MNKNIERIVKAVKDPFWLVGVYLRKASPLIKDDKLFVKIEYFLAMKKVLHLDNPVTFNEKIQWLKIYDTNAVHAKLVDKGEVKAIVGAMIGEEYIIPTLGIWSTFDEIDFDRLPNQFVLKCTHDSGGIFICKDKSRLDKAAARKTIMKNYNKKYFYEHRENPYKHVVPRIIAEPYLEDESGWQLKDYKVFCFNGKPKFVEVDYDRYKNHKLNVYDLDWNFIDFYMTSPNNPDVKIEKPERLDLMLRLAEFLAKDETFVRVDFYSVKGKVYFGELTYHPGAGMVEFHPKEYDKILGEMLKLPYEDTSC